MCELSNGKQCRLQLPQQVPLATAGDYLAFSRCVSAAYHAKGKACRASFASHRGRSTPWRKDERQASITIGRPASSNSSNTVDADSKASTRLMKRWNGWDSRRSGRFGGRTAENTRQSFSACLTFRTHIRPSMARPLVTTSHSVRPKRTRWRRERK